MAAIPQEAKDDIKDCFIGIMKKDLGLIAYGSAYRRIMHLRSPFSAYCASTEFLRLAV